MVFGWISKRVFSEKTLDYLYQKVKPKIQEDLSEILKESVLDLLHDEEFHKTLTEVGDGYYDRYRRKVMGTIGGMQRSLNYNMPGVAAEQELDFFDEEGRISLKKVLPQLLSGKLSGYFGGNKAQSGLSSGEGSRNAPEM